MEYLGTNCWFFNIHEIEWQLWGLKGHGGGGWGEQGAGVDQGVQPTGIYMGRQLGRAESIPGEDLSV